MFGKCFQVKPFSNLYLDIAFKQIYEIVSYSEMNSFKYFKAVIFKLFHSYFSLLYLVENLTSINLQIKIKIQHVTYKNLKKNS